jgi:hypothetical protein
MGMLNYEWQLTEAEALQVKGFLKKKAKDLGLRIMERPDCSRYGWLEKDWLTDTEIIVYEMDYPVEKEGRGWKYGGIEKTHLGNEGRVYSIFLWGIPQGSKIHEVVIDAAGFGSKITGREISVDCF